LQSLLHFALYLWVALQAVRFFTDGANNGALELLLVTPVEPAQIVRGQWAALWRTFLFPAVCVALLQLAGGVLAALEIKSQMVYTPPASGGATTTAFSSGPDMTAFMIGNAVIGALTFIAGLAAVAWFGMWMGLTNRKTSVAVLKTVCFVLVLPWIALMFVRGLITIMVVTGGMGVSLTLLLLVPAAIVAVLDLAKDCFFIWWARLSLRVHFRKELTREQRVSYRPPASVPPPPVLPPPLPPVATAS
jgi:hypothetical protein